MRTERTIHVALAVAVLGGSAAAHRDASAQTAVATMLVQSDAGLCLAVTRPPQNQGRAASAPALGWRVVVEACSGARNQRFQQVYGDYDDFFFEPGLCLGRVAGSGGVVLAPCDGPEPVIESGDGALGSAPIALRLGRGDLCLTAPAPGSGSSGVFIAPCDGRPSQRWTMSQER
jgi:hypothetical protein